LTIFICSQTFYYKSLTATTKRKKNKVLAVTKAITNSGFGNIIEASFPAQAFVLVDS